MIRRPPRSTRTATLFPYATLFRSRLIRSLKILAALAGLAVILAIAGAGGVLYIFYEYGRGLPDYGQLADYEPPTVTRVHAGDGRLLAEYAAEKRVFVPRDAIPRPVVHA